MGEMVNGVVLMNHVGIHVVTLGTVLPLLSITHYSQYSLLITNYLYSIYAYTHTWLQLQRL